MRKIIIFGSLLNKRGEKDNPPAGHQPGCFADGWEEEADGLFDFEQR